MVMTLKNQEGHVYAMWDSDLCILTIRRKGVDASFQLTDEGMFELLDTLKNRVA